MFGGGVGGGGARVEVSALHIREDFNFCVRWGKAQNGECVCVLGGGGGEERYRIPAGFLDREQFFTLSDPR